MDYSNTRPSMPKAARMLEARWYTDASIFDRERDCLFRNGWVFAVHASEIPTAGDYVLFAIGTDSLIVIRGEDGAVRALHNLCRHRGTRLVDAPRGTLAGAAVQCPYHAWTYGLDGALKAAPGMANTEGFERGSHGLHQAAAEVWDGHVFVHLGADPVPLAHHLDDLPAKLAAWGMADLVPIHHIAYPVATNWKLVIQNYSECLHCPIAHPQLQELSHYMSGDNDPPHAAYLGGRMDLRPGRVSLTTTGAALAKPLPGLAAKQRRIVAYYAVLPNLLLNLHPDYMLTFRLDPLSASHTDIHCTWYVHPETRDRGGFDITPAVDFWDLTNRQDWVLCERVQKGISSTVYQPGPYSNREELLWAFDRWVVERVGE